MDPNELRSTHDLAATEGLTEEKLDLALEKRYKADVIYTFVGDVLIAINPYRILPGLYSDSTSSQYCRLAGKSVLPPHIYTIADAAYQQMRRRNQPQVAVITGESGAGKTESTKLFIRQVMDVSGAGAAAAGVESAGEDGAEIAQPQTSGDSGRKRHIIEERIVQTNPMLEAFGNAQTTMNDNSSRFGKFIELKFNFAGMVQGASMAHYLLEKARVVKQGAGERNFHIFELILMADNQLLSKLKLDAQGTYGYIPYRCDDRSRLKEEWDAVYNAFPLVGFTEEETMDVWRIVAAILHLGNITFKEAGGESAEVANPDALAKVAELLAVAPQNLKDGFMTSKITVGSEVIFKQLNPEACKTSRDAVSKALYDRMFCWLVARLDLMLCPAEARDNDVSTIGILDIFGFEDFTKNGFDQLCINLANEQLHSFFNNFIFAAEIQAYNEEGVDGAAVLFADNRHVIDLFYRKPSGLLAILDEESFFPSATDKTLLEKLGSQLKDNESFEMNKGGYAFAIRHFAGPISYQGENLLEKNKDPLPNRMGDCMAEANNALARLLFRDNYLAEVRGETPGGNLERGMSRRGSKKGKGAKSKREPKKKNADKMSVSAQFAQSLAALMVRMNRCQPHFIRCIKPNPDKQPNKYVGEMVRKQLKYTGMLQTIEMRRDGYPDRKTFKELLSTYQGIVYPFTKRVEYTRSQAEDFLTKVEAKQESIVASKKLKGKTVHFNKWIVAKTKVFLKYWHVDILDTLMRPFDRAIVTVQKWVRRFIAQRKYYRLLRIYQEQVKNMVALFREMHSRGQALFNAQETLIAEEKRRGPEGLGIVAKVSKKDEAKLMKEMKKEAEQAVAGKPANAKKLIKEREKLNKSAVSWWQKYEARRKEHISPSGGFYPWFHGLISRTDAENFLYDEDEGAFLVRVSERSNGYAISFRFQGKVRHYKISHSDTGGYIVLGSEEDFPSLADLVDYYQEHKLSDENDMLGAPLLLEHDLNLDIGESNAAGGASANKPKVRQNYEQFTPRGKPGAAAANGDDDDDDDDGSPMQPSDYLEHPEKKPHWLRGKMSREEAEEELTDRGMIDGRFIVRIKSQAPNCIIYALSYCYERQFYHHLLTKKKNHDFTLNDRALRVPHLEKCIRKFQDRQYPGLATTLESDAVGAVARKLSKIDIPPDVMQEGKGGKGGKGGKKKKKESKGDLPRHFKLEAETKSAVNFCC